MTYPLSEQAQAAKAPHITLDDLIQLRHSLSTNRNPDTRGLTGFPGKVQSRRRGNGLDFDDLRRYHPGDDVRHMDWNVTARTQTPHIRLFREDRERALTVGVDLRPCMFTGSDELKATTCCKLAASALWLASGQGDRCSASVFDATGIHSSRPQIAERGALSALGLIAERYKTAFNARGEHSPQLTPWLEMINSAGRLAGSVWLFSSLDYPGDNIAQHLQAACGHGRLTLVEIVDRLETEGLPRGFYPWSTQEDKGVANLSPTDAKNLRLRLHSNRITRRETYRSSSLPLHTFHSSDQGYSAFLRALQYREGFA